MAARAWRIGYASLMKITPSNQSLILASEPPLLRSRRVRVDGEATADAESGSILKSLTIVALRADYATPSAANSRLTQDEPIDVVVTETADDEEPSPAQVLPARSLATSGVATFKADSTDTFPVSSSPSSNSAGAVPVAAYAQTQVAVLTAPKGTQLDVHA